MARSPEVTEETQNTTLNPDEENSFAKLDLESNKIDKTERHEDGGLWEKIVNASNNERFRSNAEVRQALLQELSSVTNERERRVLLRRALRLGYFTRDELKQAIRMSYRVTSIGNLQDLQNYMQAINGRKVNLGSGTHVVMLENYFEDDPNKTVDQITQGYYSIRGSGVTADLFKGKLFLVHNGKIIVDPNSDTNYFIASSHSSLAKENAYNDLKPGEYDLIGVRYKAESDAANKRGRLAFSVENGESIDTEFTGGPRKGQKARQRLIMIHLASPENSSWNWSLGCQVVIGWSPTLENIFGSDITKIRGVYHLVDPKRPDVFLDMTK